MNIKITAFLIGFLLIGLHTQAQTTFAIQGGVNMQNLNGKTSSGNKTDNSLIVGFHAGVNAMFPIATDFYFNPGLLYSVKGAQNEELGITGTYRINYLEMPLNLTYRTQVGNGFILFGFGPYVGYALNGKASFEGGSVSVDRDIKFQNTIEPGDGADFYLRPFDAGANIFFGYELQAGLFLQLNSQLGLLNIHPQDNRVNNDQTATRNTGFGLSLGFRF